MRKHTKTLARTIVLAATSWVAGCNGHIDDPDVNVFLEVATMQIPSVSAANQSGGGCVFTISDATATFNNKPKNLAAGGDPFNDIRLQDVTVTYLWDDALGVTGPVVFQLPGTVPANGTASSSFSVINGLDVISPSREGHTASLNLAFRGITVAGESVTVTSGGTLTVDTCQ